MLSKKLQKYVSINAISMVVGIYLINSIKGSPTLDLIHDILIFTIAALYIFTIIKIEITNKKLQNLENEFYNMKNHINNMPNNGINNDFQNMNNMQHNNNNPFIY